MTTTLPAPTRTLPEEATMWEALARRDAAYDGVFYYSVSTTGVFCYPSCAARPARPENIAFHATTDAARRAGFRACKRCQPELPPRRERDAALVADVCRAFEEAEEDASLDGVANAHNVSLASLQRTFQRVTGLTPRAYARALRQKRVEASLEAGSTVTETIYAAGFNSTGRFYEAAPSMLGMTPTSFKRGGERETIAYAFGECSLGSVLVASTGRGVCSIMMGNDRDALSDELRRRFSRASVVPADGESNDFVARVVALVDEPKSNAAAELPLDIRGTVFQRRVWEALRAIPLGTTATYAEIARTIGQPTASRAVAQACGANPIAVKIPCHRVVGSDGTLTGYHWGVQRKRRLLEREGALQPEAAG